MKEFKIVFSITELSNLTGKTRPTIYKYQNAYINDDLDQVPYSFIKLFEMMESKNVTKSKVIEYCYTQFIENNGSEDYKTFMKLIHENKNSINFKELINYLEEVLKDDSNKN